MRWVKTLLLMSWVAAALPATAQPVGQSFVDLVAGKRFEKSTGESATFERQGDVIIHRMFIADSSGSYTDVEKYKVVVHLDGSSARIVSSKIIDETERYTFHRNGFKVFVGDQLRQIGVLNDAGDLVIGERAADGKGYRILIMADATDGEERAIQRAGAIPTLTRPSDAKFAAMKTRFETLVTQLGPPLQRAPVQVANTTTTVRPSTGPITPPATSVGEAQLAVQRGPRHALIVANSRYTPVLGSLPNPVNDARLVAGALRSAGFQVEVVTDADQRTMKQAVARLGTRLSAAGKGATGLFYYAGHGVQARGVNYLLPVNAEPRTEADVDLDGVAADNVLKQMEDAGAATNIVILDACRDMPLARGSRTASRGLVRMEAPNGSYLAYSTAPGQTATDGGGANSPFATALAAEIARPNQPIEGVFRNVRRAVSTATGGKQTPWDASSLFDSFVFTAK